MVGTWSSRRSTAVMWTLLQSTAVRASSACTSLSLRDRCGSDELLSWHSVVVRARMGVTAVSRSTMLSSPKLASVRPHARKGESGLKDASLRHSQRQIPGRPTPALPGAGPRDATRQNESLDLRRLRYYYARVKKAHLLPLSSKHERPHADDARRGGARAAIAS